MLNGTTFTEHRGMWVVERAKGIEPSSQAWEARILPMNYARITCLFYHSFTRISRVIGKSYINISQIDKIRCII